MPGRTLKEEDKLLSSSYDQYQKIEKSGIQVEELEKDKSITVSNPKELNDKLSGLCWGKWKVYAIYKICYFDYQSRLI